MSVTKFFSITPILIGLLPMIFSLFWFLIIYIFLNRWRILQIYHKMLLEQLELKGLRRSTNVSIIPLTTFHGF